MLRLLLSVLALTCATVASAAEPLKLGATAWPPFTSPDPQANMANELVSTALQRAGIESKASLLDWSEVLSQTQAGKLDGIVTLWQTGGQQDWLLYSQPYLENRIKLARLGKPATTQPATSAMKGRTVGMITDYAYGEELEHDNSFKRLYSGNDAANFQNLLDGKVAFILIDELTYKYLKALQAPEIQQKLHLYDETVALKKLHFAIRKQHPKAVTIMERFNKAVTSMIRDGSYNRILNLPWIVTSTGDKEVAEVIVDLEARVLPEEELQPFPLFSNSDLFTKAKRRLYRINNQTYDSWEKAKDALSKEQQDATQTEQLDAPEYQLLIPLKNK